MLPKMIPFVLAFMMSSGAAAKLIDHSIVLASNTEKRLTVDAMEPTQACDRFLNDAQKARCIATLKRPVADSYLTSICDRQFDDDAFFKCLDLAEKYHFDPRAIQPCGGDVEDQERLTCLQTAGRPWKAPSRDPEPPTARFPASHKVKHGKKHPHVRASASMKKPHKKTKKKKKTSH